LTFSFPDDVAAQGYCSRHHNAAYAPNSRQHYPHQTSTFTRT